MQTNKKVNKYKCWLQKDKKIYIPHGNYNIYKKVFVLKRVSLLIFNVILSIFLYHLINSSLGEQTHQLFLVYQSCQLFHTPFQIIFWMLIRHFKQNQPLMQQYSLSQTTGEVRVFGHLSLIPTLSYVLIPFSNKHTIIK